MTHTIPHRLRVGLGMAFVILALGTVVVILNYGQGYYASGVHVTAVFPASSQGIFTDGGTAVKMRGINIGSVDAIELLPDGRARITLFLDNGVDVPTGSMASIEPLSVFGPKFIRIDPGPTELSGPFLTEGDEIARTATSPELTEILAEATELFEYVDPEDLVVVFDAISGGVIGLGDSIGRTIDNATPLLELGADHAGDLRQFLDDSAALASVTAARTPQILSTIEDLQTLLPLLNEHADDIDALLSATTSISNDFSRLLVEHQAAFDSAVNGTGAFIDGVYMQSADIPDFLDLIGSFFGGLSQVVRFPAPEGTQMAGLRGFLSLDPCLLLGVCVNGTSSASSPDPASQALLAMLPPPTGSRS